ncbi:MAG TPA: hypothetical protein PKK61_05565 [Defluviitaleaceae bacterium]|nr:hypothetical protein [Defluviitaleaceae bacterium]
MGINISFEKSEISVNTEGGVISAKPHKSEDYPGINIYVDGVLAAIVEYNKDQDKISIISYNDKDEDYVSNVTFKRGCVSNESK